MPRRKQYKISARQTAIYEAIVAELQRNPELADYDMETIEISVKEKITLRIRNIDKAINDRHCFTALIIITVMVPNNLFSDFLLYSNKIHNQLYCIIHWQPVNLKPGLPSAFFD